MTETSQSPSQSPVFVGRGQAPQAQSLADVLERVLDKGIVIVGDIQVRLLDIELLTIKVRLMIASVDKAREMGINWWEGDAFVSSLEGDGDKDKGELDKGKDKPELDVQKRLDALEARIAESERERA